MNNFRMALEDCDLSDLEFSGPRYTWCNSRSDGNFTQERLDRAVANSDWCSHFQHVEVHVLTAHTLDHNPILISYSELPLVPDFIAAVLNSKLIDSLILNVVISSKQLVNKKCLRQIE
jgi:hypothetical protein